MKRLFSILVCSLFLNIAPADAQVEVVSAVKNDLIARNVNLSGPCGAFEITKRVAWILRSQGYGLLDKPSGNNCQGYSVDFLVTPALGGIDILVDGGGENTPAWSESEPPGAFAGRFRAPFDPGDVAVPNPGTPVPNPGTLEQQILDELRAHEAAEKHRWETAAFEWGKVKTFLYKYAIPAVTAFLGGRALAN